MKCRKTLIALIIFAVASLGLLFILAMRVSPNGLYRSDLAGYYENHYGYLYFSEGKLYSFSLHPLQGTMKVHQEQYSLTSTGNIVLQTFDTIYVMKPYLWGIYIDGDDKFLRRYCFRSLCMPDKIHDYLKQAGETVYQ